MKECYICQEWDFNISCQLEFDMDSSLFFKLSQRKLKETKLMIKFLP